MSWSNTYIGTPWREFGRDRSGCDCWGLVQVVFKHELNVILPDYLDYSSITDHAQIAALITAGSETPDWHHIAQGQMKPFDLAVFRLGRLNSHVGLVIAPFRMLHMREGDSAVIECFSDRLWCRRLVGIWRHSSQMLDQP